MMVYPQPFFVDLLWWRGSRSRQRAVGMVNSFFIHSLECYAVRVGIDEVEKLK